MTQLTCIHSLRGLWAHPRLTHCSGSWQNLVLQCQILGKRKTKTLGEEWNMTKPSPLQTDSEAPYFSDLHSLPPLSPVQRGQLCLNTQKETIKWWVLGSRETASLESTVCFINLKWCRTEGFLHFLYWIPRTDVPGLCHPPCSAPASATLHSSPSFFWNPSYAIPDHSLHPGNPEPSGAWQKHGENGAKEQTLMQPMGKLVHVAHTSLQRGATELCCSTRNSKGHRQKGLVSKTGFYFLLKTVCQQLR